MVKLDKRKLSGFYRGVFEQYEKEAFPLRLLGRHGWMLFEDKKDLFDYYVNRTKLEKLNRRKVVKKRRDGVVQGYRKKSVDRPPEDIKGIVFLTKRRK